MSEPLQRVLRAEQPLTLAGVPAGFLPWLAADLARAAHGESKGGRAVLIAADETAMRALAETVPVFAPELQVLTFPAWDSLPYDRASPALRVMAERLATQVTAVVQRLREQDLVRPPGVAETIDWAEALAALGATELDADLAMTTLGSVLKYREDAERARSLDLSEILAARAGGTR